MNSNKPTIHPMFCTLLLYPNREKTAKENYTVGLVVVGAGVSLQRIWYPMNPSSSTVAITVRIINPIKYREKGLRGCSLQLTNPLRCR